MGGEKEKEKEKEKERVAHAGRWAGGLILIDELALPTVYSVCKKKRETADADSGFVT